MDKNIEYILEVARCGGITKAANNLFITPSALSKFVLGKEEELKVKLFHRVGKKFVLTQVGEYYIEKCKEIEKIHEEIDVQMERFSDMNQGTIRIGVQSSFMDTFLKSIIPEFHEMFPNIKFILREQMVDELIKMLENHQIDMVVAIIDKRESAFEYKKLYDCAFVLAVNQHHPLVKKAKNKKGFPYPWIHLKECADEANAMLMPGSYYRKYAEMFYNFYNLKPNVLYQLSATKTGLSCVVFNNAVMITLDHMLLNNSLAEEIVPLSIGEKAIYKELDLIYEKETILKEEIGRLYEIIKKHLR